MNVYAVQYGNYSPAEIDSLWDTEAGAQARADDLNTKADMSWQVSEWEVQTTADAVGVLDEAVTK